VKSFASIGQLWKYGAESLLKLRLFATILAAIFFWQSLTPSLLPRIWLVQGLVSGICAVVGYALGYLIEGTLWHLRIRPTVPHRVEPRIRRGLFVVAAAFTFFAFAESFADQTWTWDTLGVEPQARWRYVLVLPVAIAICAVVAALVRAFRFVRQWLEHGGRRIRIPDTIAVALSLALTLTLVQVLISRVVYDNILTVSNSAFASADSSVDDDEPEPPRSNLKSGGPGSTLDWSELGFRGREFVSSAPTTGQITDFVDDAIEPIRVFIGKKSASTPARRAALAVEELDRTGGFDRKVIVINTPTGTGWVDEQIVQPIEYFYGGDTAVVGVQYSHLPSHLGFLTEQNSAVASSKAVFVAIHGRIASLPQGERPALVVTGESLGAYGGQGAFSSFGRLTSQVDHAMWVGTPEFTDLHRQAKHDRSPGSRQIQPILNEHPEVAFTESGDNIDGGHNSIVYLQNADDPVPLWSPQLIFRQPDWMKEQRSPRINPQMRWTPFTTFAQITADMIVSNSFDEGTGHIYGTAPLTVWAHVLKPTGWDADKIERLRERLSTIIRR